MKDIYKMKLHEEIIIAKTEHSIEAVRKVPGGWIYRTVVNHSERTTLTSCFVPYHDSDHDLFSNRNHEDLKRELKECYLTIEKLSAKLKKAELALFQIDAVKYNPEGIRSALKEYIDNKST